MKSAKKLPPADTRAVTLIDAELERLKGLFKDAERAVRITDCTTILLMARSLRRIKKDILA